MNFKLINLMSMNFKLINLMSMSFVNKQISYFFLLRCFLMLFSANESDIYVLFFVFTIQFVGITRRVANSWHSNALYTKWFSGIGQEKNNETKDSWYSIFKTCLLIGAKFFEFQFLHDTLSWCNKLHSSINQWSNSMF